MPPLTEQAHALLRHAVRSGDVVIDATAGNGHDTKFLADLVGETGLVFAVDLQEEALQRTAALLGEATLGRVRLLRSDHAELKRIIPREHHGRTAAVMFNLGYLPGGDRTFATRVDSTMEAVRAALEILRPGGILTVIVYPGHSGGAGEAHAVEGLLLDLPPVGFTTARHLSASDSSAAPSLFVVTKLALLEEATATP